MLKGPEVMKSPVLKYNLIIGVLFISLTAESLLASSNLCSSLFKNAKDSKVIDPGEITLSFPRVENEPFKIFTSSKENPELTKKEKEWILSVIEPVLTKARALHLVGGSFNEIMFFRSGDGSGTFGLSTDNRKSIYLGDATLQKRDATVLIHELGHVLTDGISNAYMNSTFGIGEAVADLSVYLLSGTTYMGSDTSYRGIMRSMVDRHDISFDRSRSAETLSVELTPAQVRESGTTQVKYLGGELFTRIVLDLLKTPTFKKDFQFSEFLKKMGDFINFNGSAISRTKSAEALTTDILRAHSQGRSVNFDIISSLADCYWGLAILSEIHPTHNAEFKEVLHQRGIDLHILEKFIEVVQQSRQEYIRRDFVDELKSLNLKPYAEFKESEIHTEQQAIKIIQKVESYLEKTGRTIQIELNWNRDDLQLTALTSQKKIKISRGFLQQKNMTQDNFTWALFHEIGRIDGKGPRDEFGAVLEPEAGFRASIDFNRYLRQDGQPFLNHQNIPERNIRAIYFMMSFSQHYGPRAQGFHPLAQFPGPLSNLSPAILQQRWDYAVAGAFFSL